MSYIVSDQVLDPPPCYAWQPPVLPIANRQMSVTAEVKIPHKSSRAWLSLPGDIQSYVIREAPKIVRNSHSAYFYGTSVYRLSDGGALFQVASGVVSDQFSSGFLIFHPRSTPHRWTVIDIATDARVSRDTKSHGTPVGVSYVGVKHDADRFNITMSSGKRMRWYPSLERTRWI